MRLIQVQGRCGIRGTSEREQVRQRCSILHQFQLLLWKLPSQLTTMSFPPGPLSHSKTAPSKFLSDVYCQHWAGAVMFVCELTTGIEKEVWRQERAGAPRFNYNVSLLVPRNGPPPVVLKHYHPLPLPVSCKCQRQNLCPKGRESRKLMLVHNHLWPQLTHLLTLQ